MIKGLNHFVQRGLTFRHLKVMLGVEMVVKVMKGKAFPRAVDLSPIIGLQPEQFESELRDLVELRYLHEMHPTFGPLVMTYKLGSMGGVVMRQILQDGKLKTSPVV